MRLTTTVRYSGKVENKGCFWYKTSKEDLR